MASLTSNHYRYRLLVLAAASRIGLLGLAVVSNCILPDHSAGGVKVFEVEGAGSVLSWVGLLVNLHKEWDSAHFLSIAREGYASPASHAFFPLLPMGIRKIAPMLTTLPSSATLVAAGLLISNLAFVWAVLALYQLGCVVLKDLRLSYLSALSLILCPASIFFTSVYTESLYSALSFSAFVLWSHPVLWPVSLPLFLLSSACRSNGITNSLPLAVDLLLLLLLPGALSAIPHDRKKHDNPPSRPSPHPAETRAQAFRYRWLPVLCSALARLLALATMLTPYIGFQYYGYLKYCQGDAFVAATHALSEMELRWCNERVPNLYAFVQREYWGVGLFHYYQLKQVPNFLLAAPALVITVLGVKRYLCDCFPTIKAIWQGKAERDSPFSSSPYGTPAALGFQVMLAAGQVQWAFLALFTALTANVQIVTRLLCSSCPAVHWYAAYLWQHSAPSSRQRRWLLAYAVIYTVVGTIMHVNFLPWT